MKKVNITNSVYRAVFISFLITILSTATFAQKCNELIAYRDNQLINEYDKAYKKYTLNQQTKDDVLKIKNGLLNDTKWASSDAGLTVGIIAQNIKTTCTLISNLLKFNPSTGLVETAIDNTTLTLERVYQVIKAGQTINSLVSNGAEKTGYKVLLSNIGPLGQAVKTAWDLSEDISKMVTMPEDRTALKSDVKRVLDLIDAEITKYEQSINGSSLRLDEINQVKSGIDKYLLENCRPISYNGGGNSNTTNYGGSGSCVWSMQMQNVSINFTINRQNNLIFGAHLANDEVEKTVSGGCISGTRFRDSYNQAGSNLLGNKVNISFTPASFNHQKCRANFSGNITDNTIIGNISWTRYDQAPIINYTVSMPITLLR